MGQAQLNGQTIVWRDQGSGPPVILLHCSSSHSGQWKPLIETLQPEFRCLAPDLHGYGKSDLYPTGKKSCGLFDVDLVGHLMDEAGEPVHLVGHSLGGTVALRAALTFPERVRSLTLIEPVFFGFLESLEEPVRLEYLQVAHDVLVQMHFGQAEAAALRFTDFWMGDGAFDAMDANTQAYVISVMPRVAEDWFGVSAVAPEALKPDDVSGLTMPCHLIRTENTQASVQKIMDLLESALPEARRTTIPGAAHMAPVTHPAKVNPPLAAFLRKQA